MNIVCIGAHPDDCEFHAGGTCVKWARNGHRVVFVSLTNGDVGHHAMTGGVLAKRRERESQLSAERGGVESVTLDIHDGELEPTLAVRKEVVRIIRRFQADIVITHRPYDYHPDHRYTSIAVQDAAFMVTVPHFCPDVPRLERNPVFLYMMDSFTKPVPFKPDFMVAVDDVMDIKWHMLDAMESQSYEWLPWLADALDAVPDDKAERFEWLKQMWAPRFLAPKAMCGDVLEKCYGPETAKSIQYAEGFELCEYGRQPAPAEYDQLFPFFPKERV
jgi:LmbE family N-acetylglucosaminyl deacetylase